MIETNKSLKAFNSFGFTHNAERFASASSEDELQELVEHARHQNWPVFILGGGSNIVLTQDIPGLTIHMNDDRIETLQADQAGNKLVRAGAGVVWHDFVMETIRINAQGLENLSLIPGSVGAAPVQNIGAYGVEVMDRIHKVRAFHIPTISWQEFSSEDCKFSYRHSYFKDHPGEYAITHVDFKLGTQCQIEAGYQSLAADLESHSISSPTPTDISDAVIRVRQSRLPDPKVLGNAGSFFHNPVVAEKQVQELEERFPNLVSFADKKGYRKLSAAWLIDQLGYKGYVHGNVGVHEHQALVLVNLSNGNGTELLSLADKIRMAVKSQYGITLTIEPKIL